MAGHKKAKPAPTEAIGTPVLRTTFKVTEVGKPNNDGSVPAVLMPVVDDETLSGSMKLVTLDSVAAKAFVVGAEFYVDLTPVPAE